MSHMDPLTGQMVPGSLPLGPTALGSGGHHIVPKMGGGGPYMGGVDITPGMGGSYAPGPIMSGGGTYGTGPIMQDPYGGGPVMQDPYGGGPVLGPGPVYGGGPVLGGGPTYGPGPVMGGGPKYGPGPVMGGGGSYAPGPYMGKAPGLDQLMLDFYGNPISLGGAATSCAQRKCASSCA